MFSKTIYFYIWFLLWIWLDPVTRGFFFHFKFGPPFKLTSKDSKKSIKFDTQSFTREDRRIISGIHGFYGLIGPDVNMSKVESLFDLFIGDGQIQGIFFDNGELTYVKHLIRTDKVLYEEKNGRMPINMFSILLCTFIDKMRLIPNMLGLANTAILPINKNIYALYEQDQPYLMNIDFKNKTINTQKKMDIQGISTFSAHSKYNSREHIIETIDYNIFTNTVKYSCLNETMNLINQTEITTNYLPLIHDFASVGDHIIIVDSPIIIQVNDIMNTKTPVKLHEQQETYIHIINRHTFSQRTLRVPSSFYIFHYADYKETENQIILYASMYEAVDFSKFDLAGKYRRIIIDKHTDTVKIENSPIVEGFNLDFPLRYDNRVVLCNNANRTMNGFVICEGLKVIKTLFLDNKSICGEPVITYNKNIPYLLAFANENGLYNSGQSIVLIINLRTFKVIEIAIDENITFGFHSIFLKNQ